MSNHLPEMVPVSISFRGPNQNSLYKRANDAALWAGGESARRHGRKRWTLDDYDAANKEFHRVLDNLTVSNEREA